jgi:hypothetical protein
VTRLDLLFLGAAILRMIEGITKSSCFRGCSNLRGDEGLLLGNSSCRSCEMEEEVIMDVDEIADAIQYDDQEIGEKERKIFSLFNPTIIQHHHHIVSL